MYRNILGEKSWTVWLTSYFSWNVFGCVVGSVVFLFLFSLNKLLSVARGCFLFQSLLYLGYWVLFTLVPSYFSPLINLSRPLQPHISQPSHLFYHQSIVHSSRLGSESTNSASSLILLILVPRVLFVLGMPTESTYSLPHCVSPLSITTLPCVFCLSSLLY